MKRHRLTTLAALCALAPLSTAMAQDGGFYGLLRSRDLSPFGNLRLDMRPAHAVSIGTGQWVIETELGYQNTWALSPAVEEYLVGLESSGRRHIGPAEVQAIHDLPGENYLLDLESATLDLTLHYKFADHLSAYLILTAISYQGGFLDDSIEQFHKTFGFSTFGRPAAAKNQALLIYDLKGANVVFLEKPTDGGVTDPTFGLRYTGLGLPGDWHLSIETAVKVALQGERLLLSTGRTDYGVQASLQHLGRKHAFYIDAAAVYYGGTPEPAPQQSQVIPTLILGYEYRLTDRTNLNAQVYASTSVYSHRETDLDELLATKYQYSLGVRHRRENWVYSFAFNENVQNINNTPDVGFQIGFAYIPPR
jgi:uncharacterized protein DUF3187